MLALFSRILKLSGKYKCRIQGAFVCAFSIHTFKNAYLFSLSCCSLDSIRKH